MTRPASREGGRYLRDSAGKDSHFPIPGAEAAAATPQGVVDRLPGYFFSAPHRTGGASGPDHRAVDAPQLDADPPVGVELRLEPVEAPG